MTKYGPIIVEALNLNVSSAFVARFVLAKASLLNGGSVGHFSVGAKLDSVNDSHEFTNRG